MTPDPAQLKIIQVYEITADLISTFVWPLVVLIIFIMVRQPLIQILKGLPNLLSKTSRITIGDVTVEIDPKIAEGASSELRLALFGISANGIKLLVDIGRVKKLVGKLDRDFQGIHSILQELENKGLAYIKELEKDNMWGDYEYGLTELGLSAYQLVNHFLIDMLMSKKS